MASEPRIIRAQNVAPQPWRNGGGQTRELLVWPERWQATRQESAPWQLRISLAEVGRSGPFSAYPGVQRWFAVVEGAGVRLSLAGAQHRVDAASAPLHFPGELPVDCELLDGPTRDLNLMTAGGGGQMRPARAGRPWRSDHAVRGLFTRVAGTWRDDRGRERSLAPQSLLWMEGAAGSAWDFLPGMGTDGGTADGMDGNGAGDGPAGWWLAFAPAAAMGGA
jgi:environmental stress-induced protein Ves